MTSAKELNKAPVTNLEVTEICNLSDKKFKIAVLRKRNELQDNTENESELYQRKKFF